MQGRRRKPGGNIGNCNPSNVFARQLKLGNIREYSPIFKTARVAKKIWRIINTIASIWGENMLGYLSLDVICSSKLTVFLELSSQKTVRYSEQTMSADKYPSMFSRQMEGIVYISIFVGRFRRSLNWSAVRKTALVCFVFFARCFSCCALTKWRPGRDYFNYKCLLLCLAIIRISHNHHRIRLERHL